MLVLTSGDYEMQMIQSLSMISYYCLHFTDGAIRVWQLVNGIHSRTTSWGTRIGTSTATCTDGFSITIKVITTWDNCIYVFSHLQCLVFIVGINPPKHERIPTDDDTVEAVLWKQSSNIYSMTLQSKRSAIGSLKFPLIKVTTIWLHWPVHAAWSGHGMDVFSSRRISHWLTVLIKHNCWWFLLGRVFLGFWRLRGNQSQCGLLLWTFLPYPPSSYVTSTFRQILKTVSERYVNIYLTFWE